MFKAIMGTAAIAASLVALMSLFVGAYLADMGEMARGDVFDVPVMALVAALIFSGAGMLHRS